MSISFSACEDRDGGKANSKLISTFKMTTKGLSGREGGIELKEKSGSRGAAMSSTGLPQRAVVPNDTDVQGATPSRIEHPRMGDGLTARKSSAPGPGHIKHQPDIKCSSIA